MSLASEMLVRSRFSPLSITIDDSGTRFSQHEVEKLLSEHLHRAKSLVFVIPHAWYSDFVNTLLQSKVFPGVLESCSFEIDLPTDLPLLELPVELAVKSADSLRNLELKFCVFPLKSHNISLSFSHLSNLRMVVPTIPCADFLDLVSLPLACSVTLFCWEPEDADIDEYSALHPFVRRFWGNQRRIVGSIRVGDYVECVSTPNELEVAMVDANQDLGSLTIGLRLSFRSPQGFTQKTIEFLSLASLRQVTSLAVQGDSQTLGDAFWTFVASSSNEITHLRLSIPKFSPLFRILDIRDQVPTLATEDGLILDPSRGEATFSGVPIRFPQLKHLTFASADIDNQRFYKLTQFLTLRQLIGKKIQSLSFEDVTGMTEDGALHLNRYVQDQVRWVFQREPPSEYDIYENWDTDSNEL